MRKGLIEDQTFEHVDFTVEKIQQGDYDHCVFKNCNFSGTSLSFLQFSECQFVDCDFSMTKVNQTAFKDVNFRECKLLGGPTPFLNTFVLFSLHSFWS